MILEWFHETPFLHAPTQTCMFASSSRPSVNDWQTDSEFVGMPTMLPNIMRTIIGSSVLRDGSFEFMAICLRAFWKASRNFPSGGPRLVTSHQYFVLLMILPIFSGNQSSWP